MMLGAGPAPNSGFDTISLRDDHHFANNPACGGFARSARYPIYGSSFLARQILPH
jgi:hypothetical protein